MDALGREEAGQAKAERTPRLREVDRPVGWTAARRGEGQVPVPTWHQWAGHGA